MKRPKVTKPLKSTAAKPQLTGAALGVNGPTTIIFDQPKEVRAIARERIGRVKPSQAILPKTARKKPKHKKPLGEEGA